MNERDEIRADRRKIANVILNRMWFIKWRKIIQINQPTRCNNLSSLLLDVYLQLNMFRASSSPSSGAQQLQWQPLVLPLERGGISAVGRGRAG